MHRAPEHHRHERTAWFWPVLLFVLLMAATPSWAQVSREGGGFFLKTRAGFSDYLGDNNVVPFNQDAFAVEGKWPYSFGFELGYQVNDRWSASLGAQFANYLVLERF